MSLTEFDETVTLCLTDLTNLIPTNLIPSNINGSHPTMDFILQQAVENENELRRLYALSPPIVNQLGPHVGLINLFSTPEAIRRARPRSWSEPEFSVSIETGLNDSFPPKHLFALPDTLRRHAGSPCTVESLEKFQKNWDIFTNRAFVNMTNWENVVAAGGSVLACLLPLPGHTSSSWTPMLSNVHYEQYYEHSDVDLFIYGLSAEEAKARMEQIYDDICSTILYPAICVRKAGSITIRTKGNRPVQIVLRIYRSIAEILAGFDVDASCCSYDDLWVLGQNVMVNFRCLMACIRQANTVDMTRRSPSYEVRLQKYAKRGFEVYIPSLERRMIDYERVYNPRQRTFPKGLARLLVYEFLRYNKFYFPYLHYPGSRIRNVAKAFGKRLDFTPVEESSYDRVWARLPATHYSASDIGLHIDKMNKDMNSAFKLRKYNRRIHRHFISHGTMTECIEGTGCEYCPEPRTESERQLAKDESSRYIRGPMTFIEDDPGRQLIGSFNPITLEDWELGVYRQEGPLPRPSRLRRSWSALRQILP